MNSHDRRHAPRSKELEDEYKRLPIELDACLAKWGCAGKDVFWDHPMDWKTYGPIPVMNDCLEEGKRGVNCEYLKHWVDDVPPIREDRGLYDSLTQNCKSCYRRFARELSRVCTKIEAENAEHKIATDGCWHAFVKCWVRQGAPTAPLPSWFPRMFPEVGQ
ncbi:MAG: hypothetical protein U0574_06130 [Phycisphaerales bacterium]